MLGTELYQKLEQLGIHQDKEISGSDIDWIFMGDDSKPLSDFFNWFCQNVNTTDILSVNELQQYKELKEAGQALHGEQLDAMIACFSNLGNIGVPEDSQHLGLFPGEFEELLPEEKEKLQEILDKLKEQLQRLSLRKDQLSLQQLSISSDIASLNASLHAEKHSLVQHQAAALVAAQDHANSLAQLAQQHNDLARLMQGVMQDGFGFVASASLTQWRCEEKCYTDAMKHFLCKQFPQGCSSVLSGIAGKNDLMQRPASGDVLPASDSLALVQGRGEEEYAQHAAELSSLHNLLLESCQARAAAEVSVARHHAEMEEAGRALERVKRGHYVSLTNTYQQEGSSAAAMVLALEDEEQREQQVVDTLVMAAAQQPTTATITTDYSIKEQRQCYYSNKQQQVLSMLLNQLSRLDYLSVLVQCESAAVAEALQQLREAGALLEEQRESAAQRLAHLTEQQQQVEEDGLLRRLPASFAPIARLLSTDGDESEVSPDGMADISVVMANLNTNCGTNASVSETDRTASALECVLELQRGAQRSEAAALNPRTQHLNKLWGKCELLEACLSGRCTSMPGLLPSSWLAAPLLDRQAEVEEQAQQLRLHMMELLRQYEQKNKVLSSQPEEAVRLSSWTASGSV